MDVIGEAARRLAEARVVLAPVDLLPPELRPESETEAYRIQEEVHGLLAPTRFGRRAGYKIGCTTQVMRDFLGVDRPVSGGLFAGTLHGSGARLRIDDYRHLGVEFELAVRMGQDALGNKFDATSIARTVDVYFPALEIVDDRYVQWRITDTPTLIADDFFGAGVVLGAPVDAHAVSDPSQLDGTGYINDREIGRGKGSDVLDHPLNALAWLANSLSQRGRSLRRGEIVLLGSFIETRWLNRGETVRFDVDGLGSVEAIVA